MESLTRGKFLLISVLLGILFQYSYISAQEIGESAESSDEKITSIAVIPFTTKPGPATTDSEIHVSAREKYLTISLYEALLTEVTGVKIIPLKDSDTVYTNLKLEEPGSHYMKYALDTGKLLGADTVLVGVISAYREREGSGYGVESPAKVTFSVELLNTDNGKLLWETYFSETQRPLAENVFEIKKFFKRGARWITVDELAKEGARTAAQRLNEYIQEK
jgi:hypothetical protein